MRMRDLPMRKRCRSAVDCEGSTTTMRSVASRLACVINAERCADMSIPRRDADTSAGFGDERPGPMNPADATRILERVRPRMLRSKSAAANGLRQILPWQMNNTESMCSPTRLARASARRRSCCTRSGKCRTAASHDRTVPPSVRDDDLGGLPLPAPVVGGGDAPRLGAGFAVTGGKFL